MGLIDIIKPLTTVLTSAVNKSKKIKWTIPGNAENQTRAAGWEASMQPLRYAAPYLSCSFMNNGPLKNAKEGTTIWFKMVVNPKKV